MTTTAQTAAQTAAKLLAKRAAEYAARLERTGGRFTPMVQFDLLQLCNAIIGVVDDGDAMTERDNIAQSNGWDENGYPLRGDVA